MTGLYIHIPFCVSKCAYCDFLSFASESNDTMRHYTDALINEINLISGKNLTFDTLYIGGGTPTALPLPFLLEIIAAVNRLDIMPGAEFTLEANPGTLGAGYKNGEKKPRGYVSRGNGTGENTLLALRQAGINRLSLGLQAWQDALLRSLGRIHTQEEFVTNYNAAVAAGINNISVDLMFALPGQTMEMWEETLSGVIALKPGHISAYSLTPEEGTILWKRIERGDAVLPGDDIDREMYHTARKRLAAAGYVHYELSNFALPGHESKHNTRYWKRRPYLGAGLGAHSFDGAARWHNTADLSRYLSLFKTEDYEIISEQDALSEEMFLGLRLMEGVPFHPRYAKETEELVKRGLLKQKDGVISLTELGMDLANQVFMMF